MNPVVTPLTLSIRSAAAAVEALPKGRSARGCPVDDALPALVAKASRAMLVLGDHITEATLTLSEPKGWTVESARLFVSASPDLESQERL